MENMLCSLCGEGTLEELIENIEINYGGQTSVRCSLYSVCNSCGAETVTDAQLRENKRDTIRFRKDVDGLLSGEQIRKLRAHWRLTQAEAAKVFGGGPVAFSKYENDDVAQSESMDKLLRVAGEVPEAFESLLAKAGVHRSTRVDSYLAETNMYASQGTIVIGGNAGFMWSSGDMQRRLARQIEAQAHLLRRQFMHITKEVELVVHEQADEYMPELPWKTMPPELLKNQLS